MSRINSAYFTITNSPGTSGALTVGPAFTGPFRTLGASQNGLTYDVKIVEGSSWEVRTGCTYTHSGTSLSRGTLEDSSTGGAINFTSAAVVLAVETAGTFDRYDLLLQSITPGGRLTTESGVPVSTSDRTAQSTLYYTPYVHDRIVLWNGTAWVPIAFTERSIALSGLVSGRPYDVFGFISGGTLSLELLAWTSDLVRATAVTIQDGRYCKSGDKTRLLLGSIYTTGTNTTEDSVLNRYVDNVYNIIAKPLSMATGDNGHTYDLSVIRPYNNNTAHRFSIMCSLVEPLNMLFGGVVSAATAGGDAEVSYAVDSTTASSPNLVPLNTNTTTSTLRAAGGGYEVLSAGRHFVQLTQRNRTGTGSAAYSFGVMRGQVQC